nr:hypothetical protein [Citrobacter freundii]
MQYIDSEVFAKVIFDLEIRSSKARKARFYIGLTIVLVAAMLSSFIAYRLTENSRTIDLTSFIGLRSWSAPSSDIGSITKAITYELNSVYTTSKETKGKKNPLNNNENTEQSDGQFENKLDEGIAISKQQKDEAINNVAKLVDLSVKLGAIANGRPINQTDNTLSNTISTLALSAGAVAFVLYILQIAVSFIRYYSRLAELYDSQKTALLASDGNVDIATTLMDILSNDHISLGKEPSTLYAKALDTISEVAKK